MVDQSTTQQCKTDRLAVLPILVTPRTLNTALLALLTKPEPLTVAEWEIIMQLEREAR